MGSIQSVAVPDVSESDAARPWVPRQIDQDRTQPGFPASSRSTPRTNIFLIVVVVALVACVLPLRWRLVSEVPWQCDEIPLLVRTTGLCGVVSNEREAASFHPTLFSFSRGAIRGLRPPKYLSSIHTSTSLWANLTVHLFGCTPAAGRLVPFLFSVALILTTGGLAWMLFGNGAAVGWAMTIAAISPAATAYAAQTRGYAESMAMAPLLLILLEYFRRNPRSIVRLSLLVLCALQLSLTVYTTWVYWILPVMIAATWWLPRHVRNPGDRRSARARLGVGLIVLLAVMAAYTGSRLDHLTRTATSFGRPISSFQDVLNSMRSLMDGFSPAGPWLLLPVVAGIVAIGRSSSRWWLGVLALAAMVPILFAVAWGSWGYDRNLLYGLGILAALAGGGLAAMVNELARHSARRLARWVPPAGVAAMGAFWLPGLEERSEVLLPPDWGGMVRTLSLEKETVGPPWILECPTNHWQINWYRSERRPAIPWDAHSGRSIEVVVAAQVGEDGRRFVFYQADPDRKTLLARPVPEFLEKWPIDQRFRGLKLWRWRTAPLDESTSPPAPDDAVLLVVVEEGGAEGFSWEWERLAKECGALAFRPVRVGHQTVRTLLVAGDQVARLRDRLSVLDGWSRLDSVDWFGLRPVSVSTR